MVLRPEHEESNARREHGQRRDHKERREQPHGDVAQGTGRVVCVLTGHGLKDPSTALDHAGGVVPCEPDLAALEAAVLR